MRFGKHPPKIDYRTLRLRSYMAETLAPPPPSLDNLARVGTSLKVAKPVTLFPMDGNDRYGDCTIAGVAHAITLFSGLVGKKKIMATKSVLKLYMHLTGGIDSGLNELDVLNYWHKTSVDGDKILAFASVNPKNHTHVMQAIQMFGCVYLGFQVQENALEDFNAHRPWTPGRLTQDGHAVVATGYDQNGVTVLTWGSTQQGSWAWWDECVDEAYAILPPEAKKAGFAPGFNIDQLMADLGDVAN